MASAASFPADVARLSAEAENETGGPVTREVRRLKMRGYSNCSWREQTTKRSSTLSKMYAVPLLTGAKPSSNEQRREAETASPNAPSRAIQPPPLPPYVASPRQSARQSRRVRLPRRRGVTTRCAPTRCASTPGSYRGSKMRCARSGS